LILEFNWLTIRETMLLFSVLLMVSGVTWLIKIAPAEENLPDQVFDGEPLKRLIKW